METNSNTNQGIYDYDQMNFEGNIDQYKSYDAIMNSRPDGVGRTVEVHYQYDPNMSRFFHKVELMDKIDYDPQNGIPICVPHDAITLGSKNPNDLESEEAWRAFFNDMNIIPSSPNTNKNSDAYTGGVDQAMDDQTGNSLESQKKLNPPVIDNDKIPKISPKMEKRKKRKKQTDKNKAETKKFNDKKKSRKANESEKSKTKKKKVVKESFSHYEQFLKAHENDAYYETL